MTPEIRNALEFCPNLPSPPGIAIRILDLGRDPNVDLAALSNLVSKDPALASRILRASNSALFAQRRRSANLRQAMVVIGLNAAMTLALSFSLSDILQANPGARKNVCFVWRRALISASAARLLAEHLGLRDTEEIFLAALLQDLGVLALNAAIPERYGPLLANFRGHDSLLTDEQTHLGTDHGTAGAWLMRRWGLPERLALAAAAVHDPSLEKVDRGDRLFVQCVALGGQVADLFLAEPEQHAELTEKLADSAGQSLGLSHEDLQEQLDQVGRLIPEVASLYDTQIISERMATGVIDQARDILATRTIQLIHESTERQRQLQDVSPGPQRMRENASLDALTGLHNRRRFDEVLEAEFLLATENGWPISVGFIDLDHFKSINDAYGHGTGDQVISGCASLLTNLLRKRDFITRYGGDEFLVLLTGTGAQDAFTIAERLRLAMAEQMFKSPGDIEFHCTLSAGFATHMDPASQRYASAADLIQAADRALYEAKSSGRNSVRSHQRR